MRLSQRDWSPGRASRWSSRGIATRPIALRPIRHRQFDKVLPRCLLRPVSRWPCLPGKTRETLDQSGLGPRCSRPTCHVTWYKLWNNLCRRAANVFHQQSSKNGRSWRTGHWWVRSKQSKRGWRGKWRRLDDNQLTTRHLCVVRAAPPMQRLWCSSLLSSCLVVILFYLSFAVYTFSRLSSTLIWITHCVYLRATLKYLVTVSQVVQVYNERSKFNRTYTCTFVKWRFI